MLYNVGVSNHDPLNLVSFRVIFLISTVSATTAIRS